MSKPIAVDIKGLSKAYMISHEQTAQAGTLTLRDSIISTLRKPLEIFSGSPLKKEKFWALKGVNLSIQAGDVVGIIGRNGSGKSTLLKVLSRIVEPTGGLVTMNGRVASLLEVGTGFHPELTGRENVYFNGAILGMSRREIKSKFDEIVAFSEVEQFLDTPVKFYSSGMYVRLAFAVAAHLDPDILIVDEVLAVGDAAFQKKCLGKMRDVAGQGRTVLFVSHNMGTVQQLCNKCVGLAKGKVLKEGPTDKVIAYYEQADDLHESRRKITVDPSTDLAVTQVELFQGKSPTSTFSFGDDVTIQTTVKALHDMKGARVAIGLAAAAGIPIRTVWSDQVDLRAGVYHYTLTLSDIWLAAGNYSISFGTSIAGASIQNLNDTLSFSVLTSSKQEYSTILDRGSGSGFIKNQIDLSPVAVKSAMQKK